MKLCMGCMEQYEDELNICPHCGYAENTEQENAIHMSPGSIIKDRYIVGKVIGYGGFGVTYIGWDALLETKIAIKEYLPSEFSTRVVGQTEVTVFSGNSREQFDDGRKKFIEEAKKLAKFNSATGIVKIFDSFESNNTAYIIMELLEGETLAEKLARKKTFSESETIEMMIPIIESLDLVHASGIIHRDIAPDNIFVTNDGEVKLIDFGAARYATTTHSRSLSVTIKPGYSPEEQYRSRGDQGPHTDVYAVAATMYKMITGAALPDALERRTMFEKKKDILEPIHKYKKDIDENIENAILNAMNIRIEDRTADMQAFMSELTSIEPVKRRAVKIKKVDLYRWPLAAKIGVPAIACALIVFSVLFVTGVIGFDAHLRKDIVIPGGQTRVPSVINKEYNEGKEKLTEAKLITEITDKVPSKKLANNLILSQGISGGAVVQENSVVQVVISAGMQTQPVPNVKGLSLENAAEMLEDLQFVVETEEKYDDTIAERAVISQSIEGDTDAEEGSIITLTVSKGRDPSKPFTEKDISMPNFVGMKYDDAVSEAQKLGIVIKISEKRYSKGYEKDTIIEQNHEADTVIKNTSVIEFVVSWGYGIINVPDVTLMSEEKAVALLNGRGLRYNITYTEDNNIAAGHVISQTPGANTEAEPESLVELVISTGASAFDMPDVTGLQENEARSLLVGKGLVVSVNYEQDNSKTEGTVLMQSINPGADITRGETVVLTVCSHSQIISVPYVVGMTQSKAENAIRSAGLKANIVNIYSKEEDKGTVVSQSPTAGSGLRKNDIVTINVSNGKEPGANNDKEQTSSNDSGSGNDQKQNDGNEKIEIKLDKTELILNEDETAKLGFTIDKTKCTIVSQKWSSANADVAAVDGNGNIKAVKGGYTEIRLTVIVNTNNGKSLTLTDSCKVTVRETIMPSEVRLSNTDLVMNVEDTRNITATVTPDNAKDKTVTWSSSDNSIVTVDNGFIKARSEGTAIVTAKTVNGQTADCRITVKSVMPAAITLNTSTLTLSEGESASLMATVSPSNAKDKNVVWSSSNSSVATISNGTVKAISAGTARITAETINGISASCEIKVQEITAQSITLDRTYYEISVGDRISLTASVLPENAKYESAEWSSSNSSVAEVRPVVGVGVSAKSLKLIEGNVRGISAGTATITVKLSNGLSANCTIVVREKEILPESIKITSGTMLEPKQINGVTINQPNGVIMFIGDTTQLSTEILPENATNKNVTWSSSDTSVASVKDGTVTALNSGSATITAKTVNGKTSSYDIVVWALSPTSIYFDSSEATLNKGETLQLTVKHTPEMALSNSVSWSSSDSSIAKVDNGLITALKPGKATITATTQNSLKANFVVYVEDSGNFGSSVSWKVWWTGQLDITGTGEMNVVGWNVDDSAITSMVVGYGITNVDSWAFAALPNLETVNISSTVSVIEDSAFISCSKLRSVWIADGVTEIRTQAFLYCENLLTVYIPNSVTKIGFNAFDKNVTIECYPGSYAEKYAREYRLNYTLR